MGYATITYKDYLDKVYGGWYGKCLGGAAGAPVEGIKKKIEIEDFRTIMKPELPNDDLDLQLLWLDVIEEKGPHLTSRDLTEAWLAKCWYPFSEYGYFMKNARRGIAAPLSGTFNNSFFKEGMGCPIRSEIWGFIYPGQPALAAAFAKLDGELDHADNSVWAEQMLSAMESMVFLESDIHALLNIGLAYVPEHSTLSRCIRMVIRYHNEHPEDWEGCRMRILRDFGHPDFTNVTQNIGITVLALLYGNKDMSRTIQIALQCGYDADCTCATAAAILGGMIGFKQLDAELVALIHDRFVCGIDVQRRSDSVYDLSEDTCRVGVSLLQADSPLQITDIPDGLSVWQWPAPAVEGIALQVEYGGVPSVGAGDSVPLTIKVKNNTSALIEGSVVVGQLPVGWHTEADRQAVSLQPGEEAVLTNRVYCPSHVTEVSQSNLLTADFYHHSGSRLSGLTFGIAGSSVWKAYGPYFDMLDKEDDPGTPSPHGEGCVLPTLECMVNNEASLEKPYLEESFEASIADAPAARVHAHEDKLPIEDYFQLAGQYCLYLEQELLSPDARVIWLVIGNSDGFKLWVNGELYLAKDETRLWTPYNNAVRVKLQTGSNRVTLKLLKRTKELEFSIGARKYEGDHWHKKEWITDLSYGM
ncbi:ADP-ribosylglycohydrolase family protein [Paenibacillus sp. strain BS8-2]